MTTHLPKGGVYPLTHCATEFIPHCPFSTELFRDFWR